MATPKLRFKGFIQKWNSVVLEDVVYFKNGKAHEQDIAEDGEFILINSKFISTQGRVRKYTNKKNCEISAGQIAMVMSDVPNGKALGKCFYVDGTDYSLNQRICSLSPKKDHSKFLFYQINRNRYFLSFDSGVGQTNLRKDEVLECPIVLPSSYEEQQKIADFLTSVDEKINFLKKKKELLEQYKKGAMQKIFSQELRFKDEDGKDFPEWEEYKLKDILNEHGCKNVGSQVKEVFSVAKSKGVINQIEHLGRSFAATNVSHYKVLKPHDVVYTKSPTSNFPFGIIKQNKTGRTGIVSPLYGVFTPQTPQLGFILDYYFSVWQNTFNYLNPLVQKGAKNTMNIHNDTFLNGSELSLPTSPHEQQKNSRFLNCLR